MLNWNNAAIIAAYSRSMYPRRAAFWEAMASLISALSLLWYSSCLAAPFKVARVCDGDTLSAEERQPRVNEIIIELGLCSHWAIAVKQKPHRVEQILDNVGVE